ncbi:ubiquitin fusion degradation protein UFD1-domain-containing protein [Paraphysoderma sedebokerense]|nr:ubiquitin fusion degradation protein UFD1-domain-containing protein [Paraphysoderma sedebokerense]
MLFELSNPASAKATHGGVLEFIAEEGRAYLPRWMMQSLFLNEGDLITVKNVNLPLGKFVKIQPQSVDFLDIYDPRAVLEQSFRSYATLTKDDVISISYNNKQFDLLVMEVKPANAVSIVETDLEVDFAPPVGYKEPERQPSRAIGSSAVCVSLNTVQFTFRFSQIARLLTLSHRLRIRSKIPSFRHFKPRKVALKLVGMQ